MTASRWLLDMQYTTSASPTSSCVNDLDTCSTPATLSLLSAVKASAVIGLPGFAIKPALKALIGAVSSDSNEMPRRLAISALPIASAIGDRHVLPLHTNKNTRLSF
jgi:hypothetical protein